MSVHKRSKYENISLRTMVAFRTTRRYRCSYTRKLSQSLIWTPLAARNCYHSNAHEVLCVVGGSASIAFGGPEGETVEVEAGDVVVIPAGVGHCNKGSDGGFSVVGAYPQRQESYDLHTGEEGERPEVLENIRNVSLPESDPLFGEKGPLTKRW
jgi:uncharacterized protein YjlB